MCYEQQQLSSKVLAYKPLEYKRVYVSISMGCRFGSMLVPDVNAASAMETPIYLSNT